MYKKTTLRLSLWFFFGILTVGVFVHYTPGGFLAAHVVGVAHAQDDGGGDTGSGNGGNANGGNGDNGGPSGAEDGGGNGATGGTGSGNDNGDNSDGPDPGNPDPGNNGGPGLGGLGTGGVDPEGTAGAAAANAQAAEAQAADTSPGSKAAQDAASYDAATLGAGPLAGALGTQGSLTSPEMSTSDLPGPPGFFGAIAQAFGFNTTTGPQSASHGFLGGSVSANSNIVGEIVGFLGVIGLGIKAVDGLISAVTGVSPLGEIGQALGLAAPAGQTLGDKFGFGNSTETASNDTGIAGASRGGGDSTGSSGVAGGSTGSDSNSSSNAGGSSASAGGGNGSGSASSPGGSSAERGGGVLADGLDSPTLRAVGSGPTGNTDLHPNVTPQQTPAGAQVGQHCSAMAGQACASTANSCGMRSFSFVACDGSCASTTPPPEALCAKAQVQLTTRQQNVTDGESCKLVWNLITGANCTLSGGGINMSLPSSQKQGSVSSPPIHGQTVFTLTCTNSSQMVSSANVTCGLVPNEQEI